MPIRPIATVAIRHAAPASSTRRSPMRRMMWPVTKDGANMPRMWTESTPAVSPTPKPQNFIASGVAVMTKTIVL